MFIVFAAMAYSQATTLIHPAYGLSVGTVEVVVRVPASAGGAILSDETAAGFTVDGCDMLTTDAVMSGYREYEGDARAQKTIEIRYAGKRFDGTWRYLESEPEGLKFACLNIQVRAPEKRPVLFPLLLERKQQTLFVYDDAPLGMRQGTPFINKEGRVVGMLSLWDNGAPILIPASDIAAFLKLIERQRQNP